MTATAESQDRHPDPPAGGFVAEFARRDAQIELTTDDAAVLRRLVSELRWEGGPRTLVLVLPLARALRAMARFVRGLIDRLKGSAVSAAEPGESMMTTRSSLRRRAAVWLYLRTRRWTLPLIRRLYAALQRVLEKEGVINARDQVVLNNAPDSMTGLLRSMEAAMLTLALQSGQERHPGPPSSSRLPSI